MTVFLNPTEHCQKGHSIPSPFVFRPSHPVNHRSRLVGLLLPLYHRVLARVLYRHRHRERPRQSQFVSNGLVKKSEMSLQWQASVLLLLSLNGQVEESQLRSRYEYGGGGYASVKREDRSIQQRL